MNTRGFLIAAWIILAIAITTETFAGATTIATDGITIIRQRLADSVLPRDSANTSRLRALSQKYADTLQPDGSWSDIDYHNQARSLWPVAQHLDRTLVMAKAARMVRNAGHPDSSLETKTLLALRFWTNHDFQNPYWWWNQIGVPQLTGEIACLLGPALPKDQLAKIVRIMKRSDWPRGWTGANLIWGVTNQIVRGSLEENAETVRQGYERMYAEIKIVAPNKEGIQQDFSFHQHGTQLYNGSYGLAYANDIGRFISYAQDTPFQIPPDKLKIFNAYLRDGQQWMIWKDIFDYSACGREITRKGKSAGSHDWTAGPISPVGAAYSVTTEWAKLPPLVPRPAVSKVEPGRAAAGANLELRTQNLELPPLGNKQFWCSDYMVQRNANYFASVKMLSNRMQNGELVNSEGKKSVHLSDGANFLYIDGNEYRDIFPVWDWTKIPGTTAIQGTLDIGGRNPISQHGQSPFARGVSNGNVGACGMNLLRGNLSANKARFFFDGYYLCLGSAISLTHDSIHAVATDINQTLLNGPVNTDQSASPLAAGHYENRIKWIYHNRVVYAFPTPQRICLGIGPQTGRWSDIGAGSSDPVTIPVFNLWIDHGKSCRNASYQYIVIPNISPDQSDAAATRVKKDLSILADDDTQATFSHSQNLLEAIFRHPASLATPLGKIQVDHCCMIMLQKTSAGTFVTASNPENQPLTLKILLDGTPLLLNLPGGWYAGSSVQRHLN
jgi:chondroitin AC lyase